LTYANVAATAALVLAIGGSSYAAISLPKNSVGKSQLRKSSVGTRALRNHGVHWSDIAPSTRDALRGQRGRRGPPGPRGEPAAKFFAAVAANGDFVRGNATSGGHLVQGSGVYTVGFAQSISSCVYTATLGTTDATAVPPGQITVSEKAGRVEVHTFDATGAPADAAFQLIVAC
jgi:hypothetical protein